ncbi:MAG: hypothetical protein KDC46_09525 [Thermoleophilia bacterium]|nr:hypothetical protein [Thermoleophilia bacterium]
MNTISTMGAFAAPMTGRTTPAAATTTPSADKGDLLSAMQPAMDAAFAVGRPTDQRGAQAILATTGAYVDGANQTMQRIDKGIEQKLQQLETLQGSDPDAAAKLDRDIKLLQRLRDRIQLSIERVLDPLGEHDDDDVVARRSEKKADEKLRRRHEELELLEQRRALLGGSTAAALAPVDTTMVAGAYGAASAAGGGAAAGAGG